MLTDRTIHGTAPRYLQSCFTRVADMTSRHSAWSESGEFFRGGGKCKFSEVTLNLHSRHQPFRTIPSQRYDINGRDGRRCVIRSCVRSVTLTAASATHLATLPAQRTALQFDTHSTGFQGGWISTIAWPLGTSNESTYQI